jgi:putative ABC transport system substrate-binding protein
MRQVGVLVGLASSAEDASAVETLRPFQDAMQKAGWIDGRNIRMHYRFGAGDISKINAAAVELVALSPDLIYATGLPTVQALHQKTRTIPIVFTQVVDPVGFGLVKSLNQPGGNVTGFVVWDLSIGGKWIQLLQEFVPKLSRVGVLFNPDTAPYAAPVVASAKAAAPSNVTIVECHTRNVDDVETAVAALKTEPDSGLLVIPEPFTNAHRDQIIAQSARFRVPAVNPVFGAVNRGALISYSYAFEPMMRQPAAYIDRILKGETVGDLPVQSPIKYELVINAKTATALGLEIPSTLLAIADKVIE